MNDLVLKLNGWRPQALSLLRIMSGLVFLAHGTGKLLGFPAMERVPAMGSMSWFAGVIELVAGALIAVGFLTRPAAFLASGTMAFATRPGFCGCIRSSTFWPK